MDLEGLRDEFPIASRYVYLDHASTSPLSKRCVKAITKALEQRMEGGELYWDHWVREVDEVRRLVASLLRVKPEQIAFMKNTSEGLNMVAQLIDWKQGDSLVSYSKEFPTNLYPWLRLRSRGVKVRLVDHREDFSLHAEDIASKVDGTTRLVAISHVQYGSGARLDLKELRDLLPDSVQICVDAIQGLGAVELDASRLDFLCSGGHKWLMAPFGAALLYVSRYSELEPPSPGWMSVEEPEAFSPEPIYASSARRFEAGCLDFPAIVGLGESIKMLLGIGLGSIEERILRLTNLIMEGGEAMGLRLQTPKEDRLRAGIVNLRLHKPELVAAKLRGRKIITSARIGGLRVSPHFYNHEGDIELLLSSLKELM